mmetsp:Transcript_6702/g.14685  ORF Transcript_6702/g.14685 Transcript_6702/m.14685 type:complete len:163 (+) Transcript_6702:156-644(+)|eukprot:CAMPEP_0173183564 /NCGR_PEP_ID=MMETSP1141-20130122/8461_1 /TAXON_ID=483371 /ORGANISM="non described non described, Strain CCMP2298" /LENGTH=162 /DNA_ID=CAMNT_0014106779 /DNA_START=92 /DNA_END=580 /DNA_ORIENTATION=-
MLSCTKRLNKEKAQLGSTNDDQITLSADPEQIRSWSAVVVGPVDSYYEGFEFDLVIRVGVEYPLVPPSIRFKSKIFHPNVLFESGEICLDILKKEWSPAWSLHSACRAIAALLSDPAPDSPLNCDAGNMLRAGDVRAYRSVVSFYCKEHCRPVKPVTPVTLA